MQIRTTTSELLRSRTDAAVLGIVEDKTKFNEALAAADTALKGAIRHLIRSKEFTGKSGEVTTIHTLGHLPVKKVVIVGLGKSEKLDAEVARRAAGSAIRVLSKAKAKSASFSLLGNSDGISPSQCAQAIAEGCVLASYRFAIMKENDAPSLGKVTINCNRKEKSDVQQAAARGVIIAGATNIARDLANSIPQDMTPAILAEKATAIADSRGLEIEVFDENRIQALEMNALWAVGKGSDAPPRFIIMRYNGGGDSTPIGLVGKGVTFDSGGLSLKTSTGMEDMKGDMGGAAAVIGAMDAIAQLQPDANVTMLVPTVENLPSSKAYKPGDIVRAMNGKTIEVLNTDAEGRVILADALSYASEAGLSPVIDLATLTGACAIALGPVCTGAFSNCPELVQEVIAAGRTGGEPIWHMPLTEYEEYADLIKSNFADVKNIGGREGGAITGAYFLHHFIEGTPWCHLDIAPTMVSDKDNHHVSKGMTGVGARTCVNFVLNRAEATQSAEE